MAGGDLTRPALAELTEQGATAEGDDASSVAAAAMLAVDLAAEEMDFAQTRILVVCFEESGDVEIYSVADAAAAKVKAALVGDGITSGTVAAEDIARAFDEAEAVEHVERPSTPPPPMQEPA